MTKTNNLLLLLFAWVALLPVQAQDDDPDANDNNLVPNPSFERYEGALRRDGQFDLTEGWVNATDNISELFATDVRSRYISVPESSYGYEHAFDGDGYAGIMTYVYRSRNKTRTYISTQLEQKLEENKLYCVKFRVSLAERSRYATNNMGVVISKSKVSSRSASISNSNAITNQFNPIIKQTDGWYEVCSRYAAKGGEQYLTIGNFESDANTQTETLELPSKYAEEGQISGAYYFIDMVEVTKADADGLCGCESSKIPENKVIYSASVQLNDDMSVNQKIEAIDAYFYQYKSSPVSATTRSIDQIIELMKADPELYVEVIGHMDNEEIALSKSESSLTNLDEDRAKNVVNYMVNQGIERGRLMPKGVKNTQPVSKMKTPLSLAKNRRVEFVVTK